MTRIGFAYNQKPDAAGVGSSIELARAEDEPPSNGAGAATMVAPAAVADDEFAEWDAPSTIDAVAAALGRLGRVVRLEATDDFPQRLRQSRADIVFNIAEGLTGPNREAHVPAICEFYGVPYSGSDPLTLSLCLHKGRATQVLAAHGVPTPGFLLLESEEDIEALTWSEAGSRRPEVRSPKPDARAGLRFPLFVKPVQEGSSKGITERNLVRTPGELQEQVSFLLDIYDQPVIVEEFLPGAEFTCGVLGNGESSGVLPIVGARCEEVPCASLPIYGV